MRLTPVVFLASFVIACSSSSTSSDTPSGSDGGTPPGTSGDGGDDDGGGGDAGGCASAPKTGVITRAVTADPAAKQMGQMTSLALDRNGDPMIAFTSDGVDGQLFFTRWDRCAGAFTKAAALDTLGTAAPTAASVNNNNPLRQVSLARDPTSNALLIAYAKMIPAGANPSETVWVAKSTDDGATWKKEQVSFHPSDQAGDVHSASAPIVTFGEGKIWVAYGQDYTHCDATFGGAAPRCDGWLLSGDLGSWQRQVIPRGSNGPTNQSTLSLATDGAGKVALAYVTSPDTGYNRVVEFWRPASNPVAVFDSADTQNDDPAVSLAFFGTKPRIAAHLVQDSRADYDMMFAQSDDGVTWSAAVHVPRDVTRVTSSFQSLAIDAKGDLAIAARDNGGTDATPKCGSPKIARSTDGIAWVTCGADPKPEGGTSGRYVSAQYGPDGKLQLAFFNDSTDGAYGAGVLYWHE